MISAATRYFFLFVLPKAHFTSHSRISGFGSLTTPLWLYCSLRSFVYNPVHSFCPFLISSASTRSLPFIVPIFGVKCPLDISNFSEEISSLYPSVVSLYFYAPFAEEDLVSPCYSLELCIKLGVPFPSPLVFCLFSLFSYL